jgi:hypothetical protein
MLECKLESAFSAGAEVDALKLPESKRDLARFDHHWHDEILFVERKSCTVLDLTECGVSTTIMARAARLAS